MYSFLHSFRTCIAILGGFLILVGSACSSPDLSGPSTTDPSQLAWTLSLNTHAITMDTMAPYDTLQLTATVRNALGAPLSGAPVPTFTTTDSSVRVSATGMLTARAAGTHVQVIATLIYQGIRLADTALVNVTAIGNPPMFRHLDFGLNPGDSATIAAPRVFSFVYYPGTKALRAAAQDSTGTAIPGAIVALKSSDLLQATVPATTEDGVTNVTISSTSSRLGPVTIFADATVYGTTLRDSVRLSITTPLWAVYEVTKQTVMGSQTPVFMVNPSVPMTTGVGSVIWWSNSTADSLDIVFDDPTAASVVVPFPQSGGGNIAPWQGIVNGQLNLNVVRARRFLRAGTFPWHSTLTGLSGTIVVQ